MSIATVVEPGIGSFGNIATLLTEGFASYTGLPQPPASGYQYQTCTTTSWTGTSLQQGAVPAVQVGDVFIATLVSSPGSFAVTVNGDGTLDLNAGGNTSRQLVLYAIYRVTGNAIDPSNFPTSTGKFWINEVAPIWTRPVVINGTVGIAITPVDVVAQGYVSSPSGDPLAISLASGTLPNGISIVGTAIQGTATAPVTGSIFTLNAVDLTGTDSVSPTSSITINAGGVTIFPPVWTSLIYFYPDAVIGQSINLNLAKYVFSPSGLPLTFSTTGTLPVGTTVSSSGVLSGTYTATGTFQFIVVATDSLNESTPTNLITITVINTGFVLLATAVANLVNAGFVVSQPVLRVNSNTVPAGYVVSQSPAAGGLATPGTPVTLTASLGPVVTIPNPIVGNYVGMFYLDAQRSMALNNIGTFNPVWQNSNTVPDTVVISQSVAAGTPVAPNTTVILTVSMGPLQTPYSQTVNTLPI